MNSLIRMTGSRPRMYLVESDLAHDVQLSATTSNLGLNVQGPQPHYAGGANEGKPVLEELKAGQRVVWSCGLLSPKKYHAMVELNPALLSMGSAQSVRLVEPGEKAPLTIWLTAAKACDPRGLPWIARIYLLD